MNEVLVTMINNYRNINDLIEYLKGHTSKFSIAELNYALNWAGIDKTLYKTKYEKFDALIYFLENDYKDR